MQTCQPFLAILGAKDDGAVEPKPPSGGPWSRDVGSWDGVPCGGHLPVSTLGSRRQSDLVAVNRVTSSPDSNPGQASSTRTRLRGQRVVPRVPRDDLRAIFFQSDGPVIGPH